MKIVFSNLLARGTKREKLANKSDLISDPARPMTIRKRPRIADGSLSRKSAVVKRWSVVLSHARHLP